MKERARACVARSDGDDDTGRIIGGKRDQYQKKSVKGKITSSIDTNVDAASSSWPNLIHLQFSKKGSTSEGWIS